MAISWTSLRGVRRDDLIAVLYDCARDWCGILLRLSQNHAVFQENMASSSNVNFIVRLRPPQPGEQSAVDVRSPNSVAIGGSAESYEFDAVLDIDASHEDVMATLELLRRGSLQQRLILALGPRNGGKSHTICAPGGLVELAAAGMGNEGAHIRVFEVFENAIFDLLSTSGSRIPGREQRHLHDHLKSMPLSSVQQALALVRSRRRRQNGRDCSHVVFVLEGSATTVHLVDCCGEHAAQAALASATTADDYFRARYRDEDRVRDAAGVRDLAMLRRAIAFARKGETSMVSAACRSSTLTYVLRDAVRAGTTALVLTLPTDHRLVAVSRRSIELYARSFSCGLQDDPPLSGGMSCAQESHLPITVTSEEELIRTNGDHCTSLAKLPRTLDNAPLSHTGDNGCASDNSSWLHRGTSRSPSYDVFSDTIPASDWASVFPCSRDDDDEASYREARSGLIGFALTRKGESALPSASPKIQPMPEAQSSQTRTSGLVPPVSSCDVPYENTQKFMNITQVWKTTISILVSDSKRHLESPFLDVDGDAELNCGCVR